MCENAHARVSESDETHAKRVAALRAQRAIAGECLKSGSHLLVPWQVELNRVLQLVQLQLVTRAAAGAKSDIDLDALLVRLSARQHRRASKSTHTQPSATQHGPREVEAAACSQRPTGRQPPRRTRCMHGHGMQARPAPQATCAAWRVHAAIATRLVTRACSGAGSLELSAATPRSVRDPNRGTVTRARGAPLRCASAAAGSAASSHAPPTPLSCVQSVAACSRASTRAAGQNLAAPCAQPPRSPRTMAAEQSCHRGGGCVARAYARRAGGAAAGRARTGQRAEKSPSDMNVKSIRAPFHPESCGACTAPGPRRVHGPRDRTTTPRPRRAPRRGGRVRLRVAHRAGFRAGVCLRADWLLRPPRQPGRARAGTAAAAMELELRRKELGACQPRCALPTPLGRVRERPAGSRGRCRARTAWCLPGR